MKKPSASVSLESNGDAIVGATHAHEPMGLVNGGDNASYAQAGRNSCALDSPVLQQLSEPVSRKAHNLQRRCNSASCSQFSTDQNNYAEGSVSVTNAKSLYLKPAMSNQLGKVEQLPATKQNWAEYERLRLLAWRLRKNAGFAWWVPVLVALALCLLFILWLASQVGRSESYLYPYHYWRVVQNLSPCQTDGSCGDKYLIQEVNDGVANPPTEVHFRGAQHFENGHTFSWLKGRWIGTEFEIEGFDLVRGPDGKATLPKGCYPDYSQAVAGHIICEGGKARF